MKQTFPEIPRGLIDALEKQFPDKALRHDDGGLFSFGALAGEQRVMDLLRRHFLKQQETAHVHVTGHPGSS
jgi:hypothetical protein